MTETAPSTMRNDEPMATYGYSWMMRAVGERKAADRSRAGARDELDTYLKAPIEETRDVVAWWGVSVLFLSCDVVLTYHRNTRCNTPFFREWLGII